MIDKKIQEQLRKQYNPDGSQLRTIQLCLLDILIEFDRVCRKNGISYWIDSGTLIGAARHGGFIPWDDDLDVCILRKDRKRVAEALTRDLREPFICEPDRRSWIKVFNRNVTVSREVPVPGKTPSTTIQNQNIWIDVFVEHNGSARISRMISGFYGRCLRRRYGIINDGKLKHLTAVCLYPLTCLIASVARIWGRIIHPDTLIHDFGTGFYSERRLSDIFPTGEIEFEGHMFPAPSNIDGYLSRIYGDWNSLPKTIDNHNIKGIYDKQ